VKQELSLSQRVAKGGMWIFVLRVLDTCLRLIRLIILARILAPNDFGLFGIALLTMSTLETFSQTGFQTALVQKKKDISSYLDTAWTVSVIRGTILMIFLFLTAPYIARFFNTPEASFIIQVIGVSMFLGGFTNIGILYFQKELEFNRQFVFHLSTTLVEFIVVVSAAFVFKNVWALVFGLLGGSLAGLVASYVIHPHRSSFKLDLSKAKELSGFGKWIFGSSILAFLITQGDDAFVGKILGATMLGFYQMAYRIASMPTTEITHVITYVTFPAYAKMQDNLPRLREAYLRVLQVTASLSFPLAGLIFFFAPDFTKIFLGEKWMPIVPALKVLVIWGLIRSIGTLTGQVFLSLGNPGIITKLQFIALIVLGILIYPLSAKWGILGTSLAVVAAIVVPNLFAFHIIIRTLKCEVLNFGKMLSFPFVSTVFFLSIVLIVKSAYGINLSIVALVFTIIFFLVCYFLTLLLFDKFFNYRLISNLRLSIDSLIK
jgi:lipopolysaccharide exporter